MEYQTLISILLTFKRFKTVVALASSTASRATREWATTRPFRCRTCSSSTCSTTRTASTFKPARDKTSTSPRSTSKAPLQVGQPKSNSRYYFYEGSRQSWGTVQPSSRPDSAQGSSPVVVNTHIQPKSNQKFTIHNPDSGQRTQTKVNSPLLFKDFLIGLVGGRSVRRHGNTGWDHRKRTDPAAGIHSRPEHLAATKSQRGKSHLSQPGTGLRRPSQTKERFWNHGRLIS